MRRKWVVASENSSGVTVKWIVFSNRNSECSANALEAACEIAEAAGAAVCCLNVFHVGSGHSSIRSSMHDHTAALNKEAEHENRKLLARTNTRGLAVQEKCVADLYAQPVPLILEEIDKQSADLVVIGARGRSGAAGVLLGTVTEQLICRGSVPVLAVKKKGECLGVLKAILSLTG